MFYRNFFPLAPLADDGAPGNRTPQILANTGTTESSNSRKLVHGKIHIISVGAVAILVRWSKTRGLVDGVTSTNGIVLPPLSQFAFVAEDPSDSPAGSCFVYIQAADGTSAYTASIIQYQS